MERIDYYNVLGVPETATEEDVKKAYRRLAKQYHPDRQPGDKAAEERFKEIAAAYGVLSDPEKRHEYDQHRRFGRVHWRTGGKTPNWEDIFGRSARRGAPFSGVGASEVSGVGGLDDLIRTIFEQADRPRGQGRGRAAGEDLWAEVTIPFETAITGGKTMITFLWTAPCPACQGSGIKPGTSTVQCPRCHGSKEIMTERTLSVTIPAGVDDGTQLRLRGQGGKGPHGEPARDLFVTLRVEPHNFFKKQGDDIHCEVPIDSMQATMGTKLKVRTIHKTKAIVTIPPGTQTGTVFRLAGIGLWRDGRRGDQYVRVRVVTPSTLTAEQRKILDAFARSGRHKKTG
ncbi:MAG: J domain-containing protein [Candidatus Latescibacteria bacterium]|nr:J domain-containing protein [Candidatus Latescibacterota bacterium]